QVPAAGARDRGKPASLGAAAHRPVLWRGAARSRAGRRHRRHDRQGDGRRPDQRPGPRRGPDRRGGGGAGRRARPDQPGQGRGGSMTSGDCLETLRVLCHELRRPLTVIRGAAGLLTEEAGRLPEDSRQNMLRLIESSVDTMTEQLEDLLTAQQLEAGEVELTLEPVHLPALLEGAVAAVSRQEPEALIEVRPGGDLVVEAD